jgi:hypothetical protein
MYCSLIGAGKGLFFVPSPGIQSAAARSGGQKPRFAGGLELRASGAEHGEAPPFDRSEHGDGTPLFFPCLKERFSVPARAV